MSRHFTLAITSVLQSYLVTHGQGHWHLIQMMINRLHRFQEFSGLLPHCIWRHPSPSGLASSCHSLTPNLESPQRFWMDDSIVLKLWVCFLFSPSPLAGSSSISDPAALLTNPTQRFWSAPIPQFNSLNKTSILWEEKLPSDTGRKANIRSGRLSQHCTNGALWNKLC